LTDIERALLDELIALREMDRLRTLRKIDQRDGVCVVIDGRPLISFGSNDYLGLSSHPDVIAAGIEALTHGAGATGSRLTTGNFALHEELENKIAHLKHAEASIVFSSGYAANIGTIPALVGRGDLILSDELNHASLIDGCRLSRAEVRIYRHADIEHTQTLLADRQAYSRLLVVTDSVFSMDGDFAPLNKLARLCNENDGCLMVDDAHGLGVFGDSGSGVIEHLGLRGSSVTLVQMGTLSKAAGGVGGFVAGSQILIDFLRNRARSFIYSTALPPSSIAAASRALDIIKSDHSLRKRLQNNIAKLREGLHESGYTVLLGESPIVPLIIGDSGAAVTISKQLEEAGFWVPAIRPPTVPPGTSRLRITVSALHTETQISELIAAVTNAERVQSHR
jgi:8-amino-7-oxononanoate synthase